MPLLEHCREHVVPWDTWEASLAEFLTRMVEVKDITSEHQ
jgi:hypothetical protein